MPRDGSALSSQAGRAAAVGPSGVSLRAAAREPPLLALAAVAAVVFAAYSIVRHERFGSNAFDLGLFDQAVWHLSRFEAPASSIRGVPNVFGDHFSPILVLLAPLYWLWEDPRTLLIAQAALVAASAFPVFAYASGRLGRTGSYLLTTAYLLFWGIHAGIAFDFHEVAFAPLLVGLVLLFVDRRRWGPYFVCLLLLLLVKENFAVLAVFIGLYLLTLGEARRAALTIVLGGGWYLLVTAVLVPLASDGRDYQFWSYTQLGENAGDAIVNILTSPWTVPSVAVDSEQKLKLLFFLLVPFLGLALLSRVGILLIPMIAERVLSTIDNFWLPTFHYSLAIAPVLAMGAADALPRVSTWLERRFPDVTRRLGELSGRSLVVTASACILAVNVAVLVKSPLRSLGRADFYRDPPFAQVADCAIELLPDDASLAAQNPLVAHMSQRDDITAIRDTPPTEPAPDSPLAAGDPDFIVADVTSPAAQRVLEERKGRYESVLAGAGRWEVLARTGETPPRELRDCH